MTATRTILLYILTVPVFFAIDLLWLGVIARGLYRRQLGAFLADEFNWTAAVVFYLIYIGGILLFAVLPALHARSLMKAICLGAAFGFIAYATYDLTNLATVKGWPLPITLIDMAWGTVLTCSVSTVSYLIGTRLVQNGA